MAGEPSVSDLYALIQAVADRYGNAWTSQRSALVQSYDEYVLKEGTPWGLSSVADAIAYARQDGTISPLPELAHRLDQDRTKLVAKDKIDALAHDFHTWAEFQERGLDIWAGTLLLQGLVEGCPIFTAGEFVEIARVPDKELLQRPPVFISRKYEGEQWYIYAGVPGDKTEYFPPLIGDALGDKLEAIGDIIQSLEPNTSPSEGFESDQLRAAYHEFSSLFWRWYVNQDLDEEFHSKYTVGISGHENLPLRTDEMSLGIMDLIISAKEGELTTFGRNGYPAITRSHRMGAIQGTVEVSIRPEGFPDHFRDLPPDLEAVLHEKFISQLDERDYDTHVTLWANLMVNRDPENNNAYITRSAIADAWQIQPKRHKIAEDVYYDAGDRGKYLQLAGDSLERVFAMEMAFTNFPIKTENGTLTQDSFSSRVFVVTGTGKRVRLLDGSIEEQGWYYAPGLWFGKLGSLHNFYLRIAKNILKYNSYHDKFPKRCGYYYLICMRRSWRDAGIFTRDISEILDELRLVKLTDGKLKNPERQFAHYKKGNDKLQRDGQIGYWYYRDEKKRRLDVELTPTGEVMLDDAGLPIPRKDLDPKTGLPHKLLPSRGSYEAWRRLSVVIEPPNAFKPFFAKLLAGQEAQAATPLALKAPGKAKNPRRLPGRRVTPS